MTRQLIAYGSPELALVARQRKGSGLVAASIVKLATDDAREITTSFTGTCGSTVCATSFTCSIRFTSKWFNHHRVGNDFAVDSQAFRRLAQYATHPYYFPKNIDARAALLHCKPIWSLHDAFWPQSYPSLLNPENIDARASRVTSAMKRGV